MILDWNQLKRDPTVNFEELCCQLARCEPVPDNSRFVRKGTPDAGVECFWKLPDSSEWGWQAKWFPISPNSAQWREIDSSVKKALEKHPNLIKFIICLPKDRSDARIGRQKSMLQKWDDHVEKWKQIKNIDFDYWGSSEIVERLSKTEHSGRYKYFFNTNYFTEKYFADKLDDSIASAGARYTPELNVGLPIARKFDILCRTVHFYNRLKRIASKISQEYKYGIEDKLAKDIKMDLSVLDTKIKKILEILIGADKIEQEGINLSALDQHAGDCLDVIDKIFAKLGELESRDKEYKYKNRSHIENLKIRLGELKNLSKSDSLQIANTGALLLTGDAGSGKTHLFCDVAKNRIKNNQPTLLIHGGHFTKGNPMQQILQELELDGTFEEFLQSLESVAQARNCKALVMIDALNEGDGKQIWPEFLAELLEKFSRHPWISLALSVRTSYEDVVIPSEINSEKLVKIKHDGFGEKIGEATKKFFEINGIQSPSIPFFTPEFYNPLFLKILCEGLQKKGLVKIPRSLKGITSVYDFFINAINDKLSITLDYPKHQKKVWKAINVLTKLFVEKNSKFLEYDLADQSLQKILSSNKTSESLLHHLISEGILDEDLMLNENEEKITVVRFAYERLADNLIVKNILKEAKGKEPLKLFGKSGKFERYFDSERSLAEYRGIIDAISIQLPENFGIELYKLKRKFNHPVIIESFIDSLMWRLPSSMNELTELIIERKILNNNFYRNKLFRVMLTIAGDPENPFNAVFLNKHLKKISLAARDSTWSIFLHEEYIEKGNIVERLIDWSWDTDKSNINIDSRYLIGITLCWFLTSSNRRIRDTSTKALISLLIERLDILRKIIAEFHKCNDPYVMERLFAIAYGCTMKSDDKKQIKLLANETFSLIFKKGTPPPNLLLRDYAKGIIDYAIHKNIEIDIDYKKVVPPYKSDWIKYPTKKQMGELRKKIDSAPEPNTGGQYIFSSLGGAGDFYRYIIGDEPNSFDWSNMPLLTNKKSRETNLKELDTKQFDTKQLADWIIKKTFDLGWSVENFGRFDRDVGRQWNLRSANKPERIGKKYQWIAFDELLARASDNFEFSNKYRERPFRPYEGAWQIRKRDIDPSLLIRKTCQTEGSDQVSCWWVPYEYDAWKTESGLEWLKDSTDLPDFKSLLQVTNPMGKSEWFVLQCRYNSLQHISAEKDEDDTPARDIFFHIDSCLVEKSQTKKCYDWGIKQTYQDQRFPIADHDLYSFLGEYYWGSSIQTTINIGEPDWTDIEERGEKLPVKVYVSAYEYGFESEYDCSMKGKIHIPIPNKLLIEKMKLKNNSDGTFVDENNDMIAFDPSLFEKGPSAVLVRKKEFLKFLDENGYDMIWQVIGQKMILDGMLNEEWLGELGIHGVYYLKNKDIKGEQNDKFVNREILDRMRK